MDKILNFWCPICGGRLLLVEENIFVIKNVPDSTFNLSDKTIDLKVIDCKYCGAVSQIDYTLSKDYDAVYRSIGVSTLYRDYKKAQLESFLFKYKLVGTYGKALLEVGCGDGQFLEIFKELGVDCFGIDTSIENYTKCSEKGIESGVGSVCSNIPSNCYDAVFTFHYLEHLPSPVQFISNLHRVLKPSGVGLIEVPNYDFIEENNVWKEFTKDHIFYYRKRALQYLVLKCGFEIESLEETNGGVCLTMVVRKPKETNFDSMRCEVNADIENFKDLVEDLNGDFAIFGAGHYAQLILKTIQTDLGITPKRIFDSNKQKCGGKICGVTVEHRDAIFNCREFSNIIIVCGIYNNEVESMLQSMKLNNVRRIIKWD